MKIIRPLCLLLIVVFTGCFSKRIVWSPDGKYAAVLGQSGLRICNAEGQLSLLLTEEIIAVEWLPDSKRFVYSSAHPVSDWEHLSRILVPRDRVHCDKIIQQLKEGLEQGLTWPDLLKKVKNSNPLEDYYLDAALIYFKDELSGALASLTPEEKQNLRKTEVSVHFIRSASVQFPSLEAGSILVDGVLSPIYEIRCSPGGEALLFTSWGKPFEIHIASIKEKGRIELLDVNESCVFPDWDSDGRSVVYTRTLDSPIGEEEFTLGTVSRRRVLDDNGDISIADQTDDLAGILFNSMGKVRCLQDGSILFSSFDLRLPATPKEFSSRQQLILLDARRSALSQRLITGESLTEMPENLSYFEVSPDERFVSIPDDKGRVILFDLQTSNHKVLHAPRDKHLTSVPTWRSTGELCYIEFDEDGGESGKVILWQAEGKQRILSKDWPVDFIRELVQ